MPSLSGLDRRFVFPAGFGWWIGLILLADLLLQVALRAWGFYAISADESGRTLLAYRWVMGEAPLVNIWLPFYTLVNGLALQVWMDLFWVPRILSSFFGLWTLGALFWLAYELFERPAIMLVTGILAITFAPLLILSIAPLSEIMFSALLVTAVACSAHSLRSGEPGGRWLGVVCLALTTTVRYEGWIWAAAYVGTIALPDLWRHPRKLGPLAQALILTIFPLGWMASHWVISGNPFGFLGEPAARYTLLQGDSWLRLLVNSVGMQFLQQNLVTLNLIGLIALPAWQRRTLWGAQLLLWSAVALVALGLVSITGRGMPSHNFWRVAAPWSMLLLPFTAALVIRTADRLNRWPRWRWLLIASLLLLLGYAGLRPVAVFVQYPAFTIADRAAGQQVAELLATEPSQSPARILIDTSTWAYLNVMVASGRPGRFLYNTGYDPLRPQAGLITAEQIDQMALAKAEVTHLLLQKPEYQQRVEVEGGFAKVAEFGTWTLYALVQSGRTSTTTSGEAASPPDRPAA